MSTPESPIACLARAGQVHGAAAMARLRRDLEALGHRGVRLLAGDDPELPEALRDSGLGPATLLVRGRLEPADDAAVAIVGSRRPGAEGLALARALAEGLATLGITVVSGLARGIDGAAHRGALAASGRTIAVLGSGIDIVYPPEHRDLAERVAASGALLSEFPPGTRPLPHHFPRRNRIIAGLARAVVVVEAAERSGSLTTAHLALEAGRPLLVVPGSPLSPGHRGSNRLLHKGGIAALGLEDVIDTLPFAQREAAAARAVKRAPVLTDKESGCLAALSPTEPMHVDAVAGRLGISGAEAAVRLLELELRGLVVRGEGSRYVRVRSPGAFQAPAGRGTDAPVADVLSSEVAAQGGAH